MSCGSLHTEPEPVGRLRRTAGRPRSERTRTRALRPTRRYPIPTRTPSRKALKAAFYLTAAFAALTAYRFLTGEVAYGGAMTQMPVMEHRGDSAGEILVLTVIRRGPLLPHEVLGIGGPALFDNNVVATQGSDEDTALRGGATDMTRSLDNAWYVANNLAGTPVRGIQWFYMDIVPEESNAYRLGLRTGDRVVRTYPTEGPTITTIDVWRDEQMFTIDLPAPVAGEELRSGTGHTWYVRLPDSRPDMVQSRHTFGSSGGVSHVLDYLDAMTDGDLTAGLTIAATGTVDPFGRVHGIGGAGYKVEAAIRSDADVVFVPADNLVEAAKANRGRTVIVPVDTATEVIRWLCQKGSEPACRLT